MAGARKRERRIAGGRARRQTTREPPTPDQHANDLRGLQEQPPPHAEADRSIPARGGTYYRSVAELQEEKYETIEKIMRCDDIIDPQSVLDSEGRLLPDAADCYRFVRRYRRRDAPPVQFKPYKGWVFRVPAGAPIDLREARVPHLETEHLKAGLLSDVADIFLGMAISKSQYIRDLMDPAKVVGRILDDVVYPLLVAYRRLRREASTSLTGRTKTATLGQLDRAVRKILEAKLPETERPTREADAFCFEKVRGLLEERTDLPVRERHRIAMCICVLMNVAPPYQGHPDSAADALAERAKKKVSRRKSR